MKQVETDLNDLTLIGEEEIIVKWDGKEVSNDETVMRSDAGVRFARIPSRFRVSL